MRVLVAKYRVDRELWRGGGDFLDRLIPAEREALRVIQGQRGCRGGDSP